ncbi:MAG: hypothetical protein KJ747_02550 [Actinobacteria bacterium]|nr:hypothetical protein [Actinomycetota bacterium]MCG2807070.1 hypothetical protein [Coriobacteriia bacterium]
MSIPRAKLTARQAFLMLALVLAVALIALLAYVLLLSGPNALVRFGGQVRAGVEPVLTIDGPGTGEQPRFDRPMGAALGPDGTIYVADTGNDRICVFDRDGVFVREFGGHGIAKPLAGVKATWKPGTFNYPVGLDVDPAGNLYVADFRNDQIQVYDSQGVFLRRFPDPALVVGKGASGQEGTGIAVTDVAVRDGRVYATDTYQILVFSITGELLEQFGRPGTRPGNLERPNGVDVGENGTVYVADSNNNRIQALSPTGEPLWATGARVSELNKESKNPFALPRGVTVLNDDSLVVVDAFAFALIQVGPDGKIGSTWGERGVEPGQFNFPNSIDDLDDILVVSDKENDRVQVLRLTGRGSL